MSLSTDVTPAIEVAAARPYPTIFLREARVDLQLVGDDNEKVFEVRQRVKKGHAVALRLLSSSIGVRRFRTRAES